MRALSETSSLSCGKEGNVYTVSSIGHWVIYFTLFFFFWLGCDGCIWCYSCSHRTWKYRSGNVSHTHTYCNQPFRLLQICNDINSSMQAKTFVEQTKFEGGMLWIFFLWDLILIYKQVFFLSEVYADPNHASYEALKFASGVSVTFTPKVEWLLLYLTRFYQNVTCLCGICDYVVLLLLL